MIDHLRPGPRSAALGCAGIGLGANRDAAASECRGKKLNQICVLNRGSSYALGREQPRGGYGMPYFESHQTGEMRVSQAEEKACHLPARLSRIASRREAFLGGAGKKENPMNKKKAIKKIGASFIVTLGLIGLTYVLLPNGDSIGAAPKIYPRLRPESDGRRCASRPKTRADGARATAFVVRNNRGQFPARSNLPPGGRGVKAFFTRARRFLF